MKKKNMLASDTSIRYFLDMEKQDISNAKHFEYEFLKSISIKKIRCEILGDN